MDPRYYSNLNYSLSQVADFDEPVGQHMAQKAVDEFGGPEGHPLFLAFIGPVPIRQCHRVVLH